METAKVSSKGQVTIPIEIRKKLGLQEGSHVAFLEQGNLIVLVNSSMLALRQAQSEFSGMAMAADIECEYDVTRMIKEERG